MLTSSTQSYSVASRRGISKIGWRGFSGKISSTFSCSYKYFDLANISSYRVSAGGKRKGKRRVTDREHLIEETSTLIHNECFLRYLITRLSGKRKHVNIWLANISRKFSSDERGNT